MWCPDFFSENFQISLAPPLGICALFCMLWGPARGDQEPDKPDYDWEPDWECKSSFSNSFLTSSLVSRLLLDNARTDINGDWARCSVGDGSGNWLAGSGPWCCLVVAWDRGVNKMVAAARFWDPWIWQEGKDTGATGMWIVLGDLAGVIGRRGLTPSFHFEGLRIWLWRSRATLEKKFM